MQRKIDTKKKINLEAVHFGNEDPSHLCVIRIIVVSVVKKFGRQQDCCYYDSMNVQFSKQEIVALNETINVNKCQDEALI